MISTERNWVGADPGGKNAFGIAILTATGQLHMELCSCVDEAIVIVRQHVSEPLAGVGVDAPLWWSSGFSGGRHADQWLRDRYRLSGGEVQSCNSLRGAVLTQGAMFVVRIRSLFPKVPVTESHPKALLKAVAGNDWTTFARQFQLGDTPTNEHTRDAAISAVAARESFEARWPLDLSATRFGSEQDPQTYWLAPVHYYWPEA